MRSMAVACFSGGMADKTNTQLSTSTRPAASSPSLANAGSASRNLPTSGVDGAEAQRSCTKACTREGRYEGWERTSDIAWDERSQQWKRASFVFSSILSGVTFRKRRPRQKAV